jgi:hypothetical protein
MNNNNSTRAEWAVAFEDHRGRPHTWVRLDGRAWQARTGSAVFTTVVARTGETTALRSSDGTTTTAREWAASLVPFGSLVVYPAAGPYLEGAVEHDPRVDARLTPLARLAVAATGHNRRLAGADGGAVADLYHTRCAALVALVDAALDDERLLPLLAGLLPDWSGELTDLLETARLLLPASAVVCQNCADEIDEVAA